MLIDKIDEIEDHLFRFEVQQALNLLAVQIETFEELIPSWSDAHMQRFNGVLSAINTAIEDQDYQRLADLLRHELAPIVSRQVN